MTIWQFQNRLSKRLLAWGAASVAVGALLVKGNRFWRGVGWQFMGWGAMNALIALSGRAAADSRLDAMENPGLEHVQKAETEKLRRLLWINAGLDVLYLLVGRRMADGDKGDGSRSGHGLGIVLQAAFLFFFDVYHAMKIPRDK